MRNAKLLLFPLATVVLAVVVALILTWMTATPDERDEMSQWISEHTGQEEPEGTRQIEWDALPDAVMSNGVPSKWSRIIFCMSRTLILRSGFT